MSRKFSKSFIDFSYLSETEIILAGQVVNVANTGITKIDELLKALTEAPSRRYTHPYVLRNLSHFYRMSCLISWHKLYDIKWDPLYKCVCTCPCTLVTNFPLSHPDSHTTLAG